MFNDILPLQFEESTSLTIRSKRPISCNAVNLFSYNFKERDINLLKKNKKKQI